MEKCVSVLDVIVFLFLIFCCCGLVARIKSDAKEIKLLKSNEVSTMILVDLNQVNNYVPYFWERGMKEPRIQWLKEQIEKLENENKN